MLGWIAVTSALGVIVIATLWWLRRVDSLGRPRTKPWIGGTLLVVISVTSGAFWLRHHREEDRLSTVATALVGHSVRVDCQSYSGSFVDAAVEPGYVRFRPDGQPEARTIVKADECHLLLGYLRSGKATPSLAQVVAVHLITHEAMHMRGIRDEAAAECAAIQRDAQTARLMGAKPDEAIVVARRYWFGVYPQMPADYRTADCALGGRLDESSPDAPWRPRTP